MPTPYAGIVFGPSNQNLIVFSPHRPFEPLEPQWLPQVSLSSVTNLYDTASRTQLFQTFVNPSSVTTIPNAKYTFPLYESCAIVSFRCSIGTRLIEGKIKEKQEARDAYQAAVDQHEPASLLEQHTTDVFSTSLGNIPPGATVRVEIEYIMELKHDAEVDGLRFTIPTSIAPRYGDPPSGLSVDPTSTDVTVKGMNISVEISMSSHIKSVQSPSHALSVHIGGHSEDTQDHRDTFNPHQALVTLNQTSTELDKDFILLIKCDSLSSPTALLETHPTIPNSKALMLTLIPKFNLPESSKPEVVFIVDRSGSMSNHVAPLKSSLSVFLKSLPLGVNFNICSFGSHHSFLWPRSRPYSNQSFAEAQRYCDSMSADFGGTEILLPIMSTIENRFQDLNLEIMVLTDGQVWAMDEIFKYVESQTAKGDVRVFSLGIGREVSHALIDGIARVGRGFSQVVSHEREGMESKVARMLRGALSAHVLNCRLEWEGKPTEGGTTEGRPTCSPSAIRRINIFDRQANTDSPISFSDPPDFVVPSVLQAPYKLRPLFPFSRTTAYAILSSDVLPPSHVLLRGTTPAGDELELEIEVKCLPGKQETIHQLAARKILQELKEGTGYLHGGRYGVSRERQPEAFGELVKKEGARLGLMYGVASHWTSFVAVVRQDAEEQRVEDDSLGGPDDEEEYDFVDSGSEDDGDGDGNVGVASSSFWGSASNFSIPRPTRPQPPSSMPVMMMQAPPAPAIPYPTKSSFFSKSAHSSKDKSASNKGDDKHFKSSYSSYYSKPSVDLKAPKSDSPFDYSSLSSFPDTSISPPSLEPALDTFFSPSESVSSGFLGKGYDGSSVGKSKTPFTTGIKQSPPSALSMPQDRISLSKGSKFSASEIAIEYLPSTAPPTERLSSASGAQPLSLKTKTLIDLQTSEGCFVLDTALARSLGVSITALEDKLGCFVPSNADSSQARIMSVWATVLAIKLFETQLAGERSVWQLVVDKAKAWIRNLAIIGDADLKELEELAGEVLLGV